MAANLREPFGFPGISDIRATLSSYSVGADYHNSSAVPERLRDCSFSGSLCLTGLPGAIGTEGIGTGQTVRRAAAQNLKVEADQD
jgi:hypothetical protein